ncbi:MAG: tripartite tricarboxylate transporter substrate binding protein [Proteobacteria bacterium]|nr:tripartite tricarboxylate transporter substrate binding protein [Pseudomonadota bacterium]
MKKYLAIVLMIVLAGTTAWAAFPEKPITHIIPASAGGGFDLSSRVVSVGWEKLLGQPVKFEYVPGASGMIGFGKLMSKPADGYTTIITAISMQAMNINTGGSKVGWKDLAFIGNLINDPDVLLVHKDSPWKTIQEFIEAGRKAQKPLTISTSHPKAVTTFAAKIFVALTGINAKVVPFDGAKARDALAGKQVDACVGPYFSSSSKKDFIKALASFTKKKVWPGLWDVPTLSEATGKPFPSMVEPFALMVRAETVKAAPQAYKTLVSTFKAATVAPETKVMADKQRMTPFIDYWTPEECDAFVKEFQEVWDKYKNLMN